MISWLRGLLKFKKTIAAVTFTGIAYASGGLDPVVEAIPSLLNTLEMDLEKLPK